MSVLDKFVPKTKCCACETPLSLEHVNGICLLKEATWKFPVWGNILVKVWGLAVAFVCDECVRKKAVIKFAVEWIGDEVKYHPLVQLKDVDPKVFEPLARLDPTFQQRSYGIGG